MTWNGRGPASYCDDNRCNELTGHFMNRWLFLLRTLFIRAYELCCDVYNSIARK